MLRTAEGAATTGGTHPWSARASSAKESAVWLFLCLFFWAPLVESFGPSTSISETWPALLGFGHENLVAHAHSRDRAPNVAQVRLWSHVSSEDVTTRKLPALAGGVATASIWFVHPIHFWVVPVVDQPCGATGSNVSQHCSGSFCVLFSVLCCWQAQLRPSGSAVARNGAGALKPTPFLYAECSFPFGTWVWTRLRVGKFFLWLPPFEFLQ